ncbi:amidohydrolase family protein [Aquabacterium sp. J223]|uniref:amidohydrolase family protein n=1 Tax=Aquabacterium sp. J223 TaxID=2898431 RepID=UPI0021AE1230|nr:amidohydrolase family protein [Aquabacterium sp. J223]UUX97686.1 amidohydrolase [Aquabacterium sp. J223]
MDLSTGLSSRWRCCADCAPATGPRRRGLLLGALGSAALAACSTPAPPSAGGTVATTLARRIDVHHHTTPPAWLAVARGRGADGLAAGWTLEKSLADMDRAGVQTAISSITTPGVVFPHLDQAAGRRLARECNEWQARLVADQRGRFGFFAALPMLDTDGALQELAYALDTLKADGIGLLTSYGDKWLGDPAFLPIMEELNRRRAVVYTHPTAANCCVNLQANVPPVMVEFGTDTTRTIASILFNGNARRFRDIRWIFSHAGGTMPFLIERFVRHPTLVPSSAPLFPQGVQAELSRFYYDTAQVANSAALSALLKVVPVQQVVFGTDYPFRTSLDHVEGLRKAGVFDEASLAMIERTTPLSLLPQRG